MVVIKFITIFVLTKQINKMELLVQTILTFFFFFIGVMLFVTFSVLSIFGFIAIMGSTLLGYHAMFIETEPK